MISLLAVLFFSKAVYGKLSGTAADSVTSNAAVESRFSTTITPIHGATVSEAIAVTTKPSKPIREFHSDCSDPHNKEIACSVHSVDCTERLFDDVPFGQEPPEAHDLRVEAFAKATARQERHQLHVDISWQMPPKNSSTLLRAFKLEINGTDGDMCFVFNVTDFGWTRDSASPRFHFTSESLFEFSNAYRIVIHSLPKSLNHTSMVVKESRMPINPVFNDVDDQKNITQFCKTHTNTERSKWTAAFRRIFLQSTTRTIQIEFVGAPPHFCFEEYEVRLLDETGIELIRHAIVKAKDMKKEIIDGKVVYFGEYNFTGLEYGVDYIPSVIPVEMSSDGRCLCPTSEQHGACSCIAADWKRVRLQRIEKPPPVINTTIPSFARTTESNSYWPLYAIMIAFCLLLALCAIVTVVLMFYRKYTKRGKSVRIRFVSDHITSNGMVAAEPRAPLIYNYPTKVLLVYSHDCPQHDGAVLALAELLRDTFKMDVHLDVWDEAEIEKNLNDYINASIVKADKIVVINSIGAYYRVRARYLGDEIVERVHKTPLDGLFLSQVDLVIQHARVISARFTYTSSTSTLFALSPLLQYTIPENLNLFIASLTDSQMRNDPRLAGFNPNLERLQTAIVNMSQMIDADPKWFEKSHHRVRRTPVSITTTTRPLNSDVVKELPASVPAVQPLSLDGCKASMTSSPLRTGVAVVAASPLDEDAVPLLEQEKEEIEVVEENPVADDYSADSAFHSGVACEEIPSKREVLDRPRLAARTLDEAVDIHDEMDAVIDPDQKHRVASRNDSGMVSDMNSGQLSA